MDLFSKKPLFSIITVVYNNRDDLKKTIQSISSQTCMDFEYIIIDGASTDHISEVINEYRKFITRYVSEPDNGLYDAMNKGIRIATGEYLWFINAGDQLANPEIIEKISNLTKIKPDALYGETVIIDDKDQEVGLRRLKTTENLTWKSLINGLIVCHQAFIVKRILAPEYNLTYKIASDFDWVLNCLKKSAVIVNTHLVIIRFLDGGINKHHIIKSLKERFDIMVKNYGLIKVILMHFIIGIKFFLYTLIHRRF